MTKIPHIRRSVEKASWLSKRGDTFVNGAEGCVRETRKGVLHEDDPHFSELFEALKNALSVSKKPFRHAEGHALRHGPGENAEEKGHLC